MNFISLFAGIGGFDLGFERAGMTCVAQVEIDPFCQKVLQKHWANVPKFGDIRDVGKHNLPSAEVIVGGFPCQPHSLAGKRRGAKDDRDLWHEYFRIVDELRPTWVVAENVPGIRTTILDKVLSDLETIEYSTVTVDIPALAFDAPHRRHRYFIIAHAKSFNGDISAIAGEQQETLHLNGNGSSQFISNTTGNIMGKHGKSSNVAKEGGRRNDYTRRENENATWQWWQTEPAVGRVADGIPHRVDRLRALGNAVVPQVAEFIARSILEVESLEAE